MTRGEGQVDEPTREFPLAEPDRPTAAVPEPGPASGGPDAAPTGARPAGIGPDPAAHAPGRPGGRRAGFVVLGVVALVFALVLGGQLTRVWPRFANPFAAQTADRSQPALLQSIQDLSRYVAAEGNFQVVIDLQRNRRYVPDFLLNERTLFVGAGRVEAYVDFGTLPDDAVVQSADRSTVQVRLPGPQLGDADLDLERSYVFAEDRGLLNRLGEVFDGDPNRQREVYRLAEERITAAARESGLATRAQENTRAMLEKLLRSLGFSTVTVTFASG
ncbi:MAG TPA: DUF4230 domain-containing protein [Pilimelia sp.]|nr:DUF4230 domain-containing protein [Pilimelia sp.]